MYGQASELVAFRLVPLEEKFRKKIDADWSSQVINVEKRTVAFTDRSVGKITSWNWDFGDGKTSTEQNPIHVYEKPDKYVVTLNIEGPDGKSRRAKVWHIAVR